EPRDAFGKGGPQEVVELAAVDLEGEVREVLGLGRGVARDEALALGPKPGAGRVDDEREAGRLPARVEDEDAAPARLDRKWDAGHRGQLARPWPGRVHEGAGRPVVPAGNPSQPDPPAFAVPADRLGRRAA